MKSIAKGRIADTTTDRIVSQTVDAVNFLLTNSLLKTITISAAFNGAGTIAFSHPLGKIPEGWIIIDRTSSASIYRNSSTSTTITLTASAAGTFTLILF